MRFVKEKLRPIKHALFGKQGIHRALELVREQRRDQGGDRVQVVFDIGAAVGDTALLIAQAFPRATLFCFEPLPESFARMRKRMSSLGDRVRCFPFGLYNRNGDITLHVASAADSSSILPLELAGKKYSALGIREIGRIRLQVRTLDDVAEEIGCDVIDFMKIDVEGVEREVLEGGKHTLARAVRNLYIEIEPLRRGVHSPDYLRVFAYLHDAGFSLVGALDENDFFFSKLT